MKPLLGALPLLLPIPALAQTQQPQFGQQVPPIQDTGEEYVLNFAEDIQDRLTLEQFVKLCQEATRLNFTYNEETQARLASGKVTMFGPKRVPKKDFYNFFQIQMFINEFVCVEVGPPHISVILIQSLQQGARGAANLKQRATHVTPDELPLYADQPATLITTVLTLPNIDTRQLTTSLRGMLTDVNTQTLLPVGENSVILQGFGSYIASLARLLLIVDAESAIPEPVLPIFEVVPLEYAAAEDVSNLLEELLEQLRESSRNAASRRAARPVAEGQGVSGPLVGAEVDTTILVDPRTNSLLIMAMPEEMPRIKDLAARLDVDVIEPERNFHIYNLENVQAEDIADVLDEFLRDAERVARNQQGGTGGRAQAAPGGAAPTSTRQDEVVVVPDVASNSLLIAAGKSRYEEVLELIRQLDRRQDQVLIETALIELTGNDLTSLGVEWSLSERLTDSQGNTLPGDAGFGVSSFGLSTITPDGSGGFTRTPNVAPGLTAGIIDGTTLNLPVLIAAAENSSNANVLNIPSVLVNNNGSATVETKDEQPTTTQTNNANVGTTTTFDSYQEAGITLTISPSISAARYLRLNIQLKVSNFTAAFSGGNVPPPRTTRLMQTSVNVPDGDTMVIGGVISDIQREARDGIPWLGRLPLLGFLFRNDSTSSARTTLYFFVTPHILKDRDFADLAEISYRKKLRAAEVIGEDRIRVVDPLFGSEDGGIDFESFQVPLYRSPARGEIAPSAAGIDAVRRQELMGASEEPAASGGQRDP